METKIVKKVQDFDIYSEINKAGINHQQLVVSNLLGEFSELVVSWRDNPQKFKSEFAKLRKKAITPYGNSEITDQDRILIDIVYTHITNFVLREIEPKIEEHLQLTRVRKRQNIEWGVKGAGSILKSTTVGTFKHGIPGSMIAIGGYHLMRASAILGGAISTFDSYTKDPFGRCQTINAPNRLYQEQLKEYESTWFKTFKGLEAPMLGSRESGFFDSFTDTVLCSVPQWSTGIAGGFVSGGAEISGAITQTFAAFVIFLLGIMLWLLANKNSQFGIPFLFYFGFSDPESKVGLGVIQNIQTIAPAITSGAVSPPKKIKKEVERIEDIAQEKYVRTIDNTVGSPSTKRIEDATLARIEILEIHSRNTNPVAKLILQSKAEDQKIELNQIETGQKIPKIPLTLLSQITNAKKNKSRYSPKKSPNKSVAPISFISQINEGVKLKSANKRKLKSPPKKSPNTGFNTNMLRKLAERRKQLEGDDDWSFGRKSRRRKSRRSKSRRSKSRRRKSPRSKSRRRKSRQSKL
jgi:hypothetical protein